MTRNTTRRAILRSAPLALALTAPVWLGACNLGQTSGGEQAGVIGAFTEKPGGGFFIVDRNQSGQANRLRIAGLFWGRLVDVFDVDAVTGEPNPEPVFRDLAINENVKSLSDDFILETNPLTQATSLVVQRTRGAPDNGGGTFEDLVRQATQDMPTVAPRGDDGFTGGGVSLVARNAVLVIRFDDLLDDRAEVEASLPNLVRVLTGYPPTNVYQARMRFDPNYGGAVGGAFHSSRIIVDMTVSELEAAGSQQALDVNLLGLPASLVTTGQPNVSIRIPSREDPASAQFEILRNLKGKQLAESNNGPVDTGVGTVDIVRGMRSGNRQDGGSNGFLVDEDPPQVMAEWDSRIDSAVFDPDGTPGFDLLVELFFPTPCQAQPRVGDLVVAGARLLEVSAIGGIPVDGTVRDLKLRLLAEQPIANPAFLVGLTQFQTIFSPEVAVPAGCWVRFSPQARILPATSVPPDARVIAQFTEPIDPGSLTPFDSFQVLRGDASVEGMIDNTVVARVERTRDLRRFTHAPVQPLSHPGGGGGELYHVEFGRGEDGPMDLAGNPLVDSLPEIEFTVDPDADPVDNGSLVFRFASIDEYQAGFDNAARDWPDWSGQMVFDLDREVVTPRQVVRQSHPVDPSNPVPALMLNIPGGSQTPLSPLGSKLQTVWRYADAGWLAFDESKWNLDVEGLNWSPVAGQAIADFYSNFEIRLAHGSQLPDEAANSNPPLPYIVYRPLSGLFDKPLRFTANILSDPDNPQTIVHNRAFGYRVDPADLSQTTTGTPIMPFPLNRAGGPTTTYTWRDTAILGRGANGGAGVPMDIEVIPLVGQGAPGDSGAGLGPLYSQPDPANRTEIPFFNPNLGGNNCVMGRECAGKIYCDQNAGTGCHSSGFGVRTIGLPLLMEFRTFPSNAGIGLNSFSVGQALSPPPPAGTVPFPRMPNFRAFSTGGTDPTGTPISVNPDLEEIPGGGFNPLSTPPGLKTLSADNVFYFGQLDTVTRISRSVSVALDPLPLLRDQSGGAEFGIPLVEPRAGDQPAGTQILVEFRGVTPVAMNPRPYQGDRLDLYGRQRDPRSAIFSETGEWSASPNDGADLNSMQIRLTFISNITDTNLSPELSTLAIPFRAR